MVDRFRSMLTAALRNGANTLGYDPLQIDKTKFSNGRVRYLIEEHANKLIAACTPHVQIIDMTLRFTGCRAQETLQLQIINLD